MSKVASISYETTLLVRDSCLCLHVQRAARILARRFDEALRPLDLTNGQFSLMMALNRPQPSSMGELAAQLAMDRTTLTAALKPLVRRQLVAAAVNPQDKRLRRVVLTPAGEQLLASAMPIWERAHRAVEEQLAGGDADGLRRNLRALS